MAKIVSAGQKWARSEKLYLHYEWTSDTNILMEGGQGDDLSVLKRILIFKVLTKLKTVKKRLRQCHYLPTYYKLKIGY